MHSESRQRLTHKGVWQSCVACAYADTRFNKKLGGYAGGASTIFNELSAPEFRLDSFLSLHLLHAGVTAAQRAATLRLLQALFTPHSLLSASPASTAVRSGASEPAASPLLPLQLTIDNQQDSHTSSEPSAGHEAGSATAEAGSGQHSISVSALQELQLKLLSRLFSALPLVLESAVSHANLQELKPPGSLASASDASIQSVSQTESETEIQPQSRQEDQADQQESDATVIDGDAIHAVLGLILKSTRDAGPQGMSALLAFPNSLSAVMPDLLAAPQVSVICMHSRKV